MSVVTDVAYCIFIVSCDGFALFLPFTIKAIIWVTFIHQFNTRL